ncbi:MAG: two-component regulator propeller domain-containing protein, partial [Proteiniphilum sp.]|nr:two-component regulator propeller domain-containing protein [Proteiniphilum sp.]
MNRRIITFWVLLTLFPTVNRADDIIFSRVGIEEGLSQLSVMTIYQDELGNMWFGTREGLNIYNGSRMKVLQPNSSRRNALSGNLIKDIDGDLNGTVYIHTQNGIDQYDLKTGSITQIIKIQVNAMTFANHHLWYAKQNQIYLYNDNGESFLYAETDADSQITTLLPTSDGRLFVGTIASGLYQIVARKKAIRILADCSRISHLFEDGEKNIWVSTWEEGLFRVTRDNLILNYRQNKKNPAGGLSSNFVRAVCEDGNGNLWIGTRQGLNKLDKQQQQFSHFDSEVSDERSLSNESVWSLCKDKYGNIWIGTYFGGVNYFNPKSNIFTSHNLRKGIYATKPFPIISAIIPYTAQTFFLCTEGDGLLLYNCRDKTYTDTDSLKNENIKAAYYDKEDGKLYLGLHLGGMAIFDPVSRQLKRYRQIRPDLDQ